MNSQASGRAGSDRIAVPPSPYSKAISEVLATQLDDHACSARHLSSSTSSTHSGERFWFQQLVISLRVNSYSSRRSPYPMETLPRWSLYNQVWDDVLKIRAPESTRISKLDDIEDVVTYLGNLIIQATSRIIDQSPNMLTQELVLKARHGKPRRTQDLPLARFSRRRSFPGVNHIWRKA
ncbi:hypothetical protein DVH24_002236 [Malus domestica]|uniref:Uncharacterized protein n=1 Tax=Malus domestica TaxID=3750 RepID=A0A498I4Q0_MALDO|nr:hypothetical protein DVH24_002236 [Malus domestica]